MARSLHGTSTEGGVAACWLPAAEGQSASGSPGSDREAWSKRGKDTAAARPRETTKHPFYMPYR